MTSAIIANYPRFLAAANTLGVATLKRGTYGHIAAIFVALGDNGEFVDRHSPVLSVRLYVHALLDGHGWVESLNLELSAYAAMRLVPT